MLKFSSNISTMFKEHAFLERFRHAHANGFNAVEFQDPFVFNEMDIFRAKGPVEVDLVNLCLGPENMGSAAGLTEKYLESFDQIKKYHFNLQFKKIHIMSGMENQLFGSEEQKSLMINNLNLSLEYLEDMNLTAVIEPICQEVKPGYFLNNFDTAVDIIKEVDSPQVKLLLDVYHLYKITGDVKNLEKFYPFAGHIQISQDPERREPFHPEGKIDYDYVFNFLKEKKHSDFIGLEYVPSGSTIESLQWINTVNSN